MGSALPLSSFPIACTSDPEEARASFARVYGSPVMDFTGPDRTLRTIINHCKLQHVDINYATYGADLCLQYPESEFTSQIFLTGGKGEAVIEGHTVAVDRGHSAVIPANAPFELNIDAYYERFVLCVRPDSLTRILSTLTGMAISSPVEITPAQDITGLSQQLFRDQLMFFVGQLDVADSVPPILLNEFEYALVVAFLHANRHNYSHLLERKLPEVAPIEVRRAEEYIEANWKNAITLEDLMVITEVSALSLYRSFLKHRGYSPMQFLDCVRLRHRH